MYTISEAAARSGVSVATLRAWERRYHVVAPVRTPAGYRLYDDVAIDRLRAMRALIAEGWRPRQAADRAAELDPSGVVSGSPPLAPWTASALLDLVDAAGRLDLPRVERALDEAFARSSVEEAVESLIAPALEQIGESWAEGTLDVAAEHGTSQAILRRLATIFDIGGRADEAPALLVGLPPGSRHELGALAFAIAARRAGVSTVYLGPDVPAESWVAALGQTGARAIAVGVSTVSDADAAREILSRVAAADPGVTRLAGGRGAGALTGMSGLTVLSDTLAGAARTTRQLLARRR